MDLGILLIIIMVIMIFVPFTLQIINEKNYIDEEIDVPINVVKNVTKEK